MGFIKIADSSAGKVFVGEHEVSGIYVGDERLYPGIVRVDTGTDADEWVYSDPTRTRTLRSWEQDVYADGSRGEKRYTDTSAETQTAAVTTDWDGATYWNGACGSDYYYVDYQKVRTKYAYADTARYSDWRNGDPRSRRVDGQCGWVRDWRVSADWANTGSTCNSAGTAGQYNCDGTYTVKYNQQRRTLSYCYPDMSGSTQTKTEYRAGSVASRSQVNGQCGYSVKPTIRLYAGSVDSGGYCRVSASPTPLDNITISLEAYGDPESGRMVRSAKPGTAYGTVSFSPTTSGEEICFGTIAAYGYATITRVSCGSNYSNNSPLVTNNAIYTW